MLLGVRQACDAREVQLPGEVAHDDHDAARVQGAERQDDVGLQVAPAGAVVPAHRVVVAPDQGVDKVDGVHEHDDAAQERGRELAVLP